MGKKLIWVLIACFIVISGCSSESSGSKESSSSSKSEEKPKESKETTKTESTTQKQPSQETPSATVDPKKAYLSTVYKQMKHLEEAKVTLQNQLNAYYKQDKEIATTQTWKDEMSKGYNAVESVHTNMKTYPEDTIPVEYKDHHYQLIHGLDLMVKSKEFIMRGFPQNSEDVSTTGAAFLNQGNSLVDGQLLN
ncbi:hypothetical protein [Bacillus toyonensis]|uniref:hypothetical protein n=1 Tax=Bacillus toyonensis TaxID=155322 RepID=UPI000BEFA1ED|nr:hypothetical protein [Bacillus toyonensis]PEK76009.1 hypothetical protein CN594_29490 [Bacillus toyonensis]PFY44077.1 hypothetical protein COL54_12450 [Bacillus toyonensis]PFY49340.1 hypothetical protein COL55_12460 [Bacillus toyonensis]PFY80830.1 hypothetical protein COL62_12470 [Bacillus toyonensis]PGD17686.1 hypothetical protein COM37_22225 [Bacillus toyonensis]